MTNDCKAKSRAWYIDFNKKSWRLIKLTFTNNKTFVNLAEADTSHSSDAETEDTNLQDSHEKRTNNRMKINQDSKDVREHDNRNFWKAGDTESLSENARCSNLLLKKHACWI